MNGDGQFGLGFEWTAPAYQLFSDVFIGNLEKLIRQLPVDSWHQYIGEATLADAILRLIHNAHRLPMLNPCAGYHQKLHLIFSIQMRKKRRRKKKKN
uniref:IstB-like ATP binding protein n=1 Tax=Candidatus Kentrum sp. MB TaxID=2138164 RepID=A0A450XG38_9GAMM|nr:MAG: IstB-like ATP binding protein [Candidatus Kentron sp. MB]